MLGPSLSLLNSLTNPQCWKHSDCLEYPFHERMLSDCLSERFPRVTLTVDPREIVLKSVHLGRPSPVTGFT